MYKLSSRRQGKSWLMDSMKQGMMRQAEMRVAAHYGKNWVEEMSSASLHAVAPHPVLKLPVFKTNTKSMSEFIREGTPVPNVQMWCNLHEDKKSAALFWFRRHTLSELETAVATMLMMGREQIYLIRSFELP